MNSSPHPSPTRGIGARISQVGLNCIYLISVLSIVPQKIKLRLSFFDSNYKMSASWRLYKRDN
jgi:hypothetical protein